MSEYEQRFGGLARLYGREALEQFHRSHVAVIGIGGVGSWAVEALARSGIGRLTLIDLDDICITNTNRQIHAVTGQLGRLKVEAMADRARVINPEITVDVVPEFLTTSNVGSLLSRSFHCVLDAIDNVPNKCLLLAECRKRDLPVVTTGGAGGRRDPTQIRAADLSRVTHDALIKQVRKTLRQNHGFPIDPKASLNIRCVFSTETVTFPWSNGTVCEHRETSDESLRLDCNSGYGTATFLTGAFGFAAAGVVLDRLLQQSRAI